MRPGDADPGSRCPHCGQRLRLDLRRQAAVVRAYRKDGATLHSVGRKFGVSHVMVLMILKRAGVERRPKGRQA